MGCCCGCFVKKHPDSFLEEETFPMTANLRRRVPVGELCGQTSEGVPAYSNGNSNHWTNEKHYQDKFFMGYKWQCVEFARRWLWMTKGLLLPSKNCAYCFADITSVKKPVFMDDKTEPKLVSVPCRFVSQGASTPPVGKSLIIYPMSPGSPWGHIGVITDVDLERNIVYVADQNRFFHDWGERKYSAAFRLSVDGGRYYIEDHESECMGWLQFE